MTTTIAFASTNDAYLVSSDNNYITATEGPADSVSAGGDTSLFVGQQKSGTPYTVWESFLEFGYTASTNMSPVGAYIRLNSTTVTGTGVYRDLEISKFDHGGTITTADWRSPVQLNSLPTAGTLAGTLGHRK